MVDIVNPFDIPLGSIRDYLKLEQFEPGKVDVFFHPIPRFELDDDDVTKPETSVRILQIDVLSGRLTMFPTRNLTRPFLEVGPKYQQIERISFSGGRVVYTTSRDDSTQQDVHGKFLGSYFGKTETVPLVQGERIPEIIDTVPTSVDDVFSLLESLPSYCVKDPQHGLGFKRQYRAVVQAIEALTNASEIQIYEDHLTTYIENSETFALATTDMQRLIKSIEQVDRTTRTAANSVNETSIYNALADVLGKPNRPLRYGRTDLRRTLTAIANGEKRLTRVEQTELIETLTSNAGEILRQEPTAVEGLELGIAVARARSLHGDLERMMNMNLPESHWQRFFQSNPFVLSLVFGRPIIKIGSQASVGGKTILGHGEKIADFLVKNSLTNNAAIVEIKTPNAKLLNQTPYRQSVFTPSGELVGAINQVLDQKNRFEQDISGIRNRNRSLDVEAHHVHTCLLIGTLPANQLKTRSFELFRHNLKDVAVLTFDELLHKVEDLCAFLEGKSEPVEAILPKDDADIPF